MFASRARPYFGVEEGDNTTPNCRIGDVYPDSPAQRAGIKPGDVITSFDGKKIESFDDLTRQLVPHKPGDEVVVQILRDDKPMTLTVVIARRPR
jgi:S1-C subfamily serine protease